MDTYETILKRRSIRSYIVSKDVEEEKIEKILNAAFHAPIASGKYDNLLIKIYKNEKLKELQNELISLTNKDNTYNAPLVFFIYHKGENIDLANLDSGAVIENILLEATNLSLGSLFIYSFVRLAKEHPFFKKYYEIKREDGNYILRSIVSLGYIDKENVSNIEHKMKVEVE